MDIFNIDVDAFETPKMTSEEFVLESKKILSKLMDEYGTSFYNRKITEEEYTMVEKTMEDLGFYNGWIQKMTSAHTYKPDFLRENPFRD